MNDYTVVGKPLPRIDGPALASGQALYSVDIALPGMLYGKILRSPYPHARVLNINIDKAKKLSGVREVITAKETPRLPFWTQFGAQVTYTDKCPLADERVRFVGDEVAAVAAIDEEIAEQALELIQVDYQELAAVFDPEIAMGPGAPDISGKGSNIAWEIHQNIGDFQAGFDQSDYIREDRFTTQPVTHFCLEPHNCVASFGAEGKVTIWSSTQAPYNIRGSVSQSLSIPVSQVRVITPAVGGGFGGKGGAFSHEVCAVLLSQKTGRPVKIVLARDEIVNATRVRHPHILDMKTGAKKDGTLMAEQVRLISDNGAYANLGGLGLLLAVTFLTGPFRVPNMKCDAYQVYTNNPMGGAMRGYGKAQTHFAINCHLDMIARDLGIDTAELMIKNGARPGETMPNGFRITSCGLAQCITEASKAAGLKKVLSGKKSQGVGIAAYTYQTGLDRDPRTSSSAVVKVHEDGGISLLTGAVDIGQGCRTALAQIVAEEFGVGLDDVRWVLQDTELTPLDIGTFSSRVTFWAGNAVKAAAADAKKQLFQIMADKLEANPVDLVAKDKKVYVKGSPDRGIPMAEAVLACQLATQGRPIIGRGYYSRPPNPWNPRTGQGNISEAYSYGANLAEVEVDHETGEVKILRLIMAHDCGFAINPMAVEGQLEGCALMGMGFAFSEELLRDRELTMNPSFLDYKIPVSLSAPEIETILVETIDPEGPFGGKEAGEGLLLSIAPAVSNAIYDAVGIRVKSLPITPEKILKALESKGYEQPRIPAKRANDIPP